MAEVKAAYVDEKHISNNSTPPADSLKYVAATTNPLDGPDANKSEEEREALVRDSQKAQRQRLC